MVNKNSIGGIIFVVIFLAFVGLFCYAFIDITQNSCSERGYDGYGENINGTHKSCYMNTDFDNTTGGTKKYYEIVVVLTFLLLVYILKILYLF